MTAANILVIHDQGATNVYGGTSFAAPLWAGFLALVNRNRPATPCGVRGAAGSCMLHGASEPADC